MSSYASMSPDQRSDEFDSVVSYLSAISQRLSQTEILDIADTLRELIRRRKAPRRQRPTSAARPGSAVLMQR
jgi:hypothetical protein